MNKSIKNPKPSTPGQNPNSYNQWKEVIFHVGLAKTGTTYLQHKFFPKLKGIKYIQRTKYRDFKYVRIIKNTSYDKYLISNEFDRQIKQELENIASAFPHTKIIIVLRRHDSWIASQYRRWIKNGHPFTFKEFLDLENDQGFWKQEDLYFFPLLQLIEEKFKSKPLVLFYDELRKDPFAFLDKIAGFLDATYDKNSISLFPKHKSFNENQLKVTRKLGRIFFKKHFEYSRKYWVSKIQRLLRMIPRYVILYSSLLVPGFLVGKAPLIPNEELEKVRKHYDKDWNQCLDYASRP